MFDSQDSTAEPIAIIGSSCRFPGGSNSPRKLWELLEQPVDLLTQIPHTRFNPTAFYHESAENPGTTNVTKAYLLQEDPWAFDNDFFNISPREAESMDPQQRIILETVYECIESAGYSMSQLRGSSTGVFVGQMSDDYRDLVLRDMDSHSRYAGTGIARSMLANRVSYAFDWKGPSVNVDTACSSSLVALHQAIQSLRSGESEMAVVAGVNLVFSPELFSLLSSLNMLSPTGRSRMWDTNADGYARGEGFAAVIIKTLKKSQADHDSIESIIRNTGVNQDGRSTGLTVPSATAQAQLIASTYAGCGLDCQTESGRCQYFEAHGTGTPTGDPKEAEGISTAFFPNIRRGNLSNQSAEVPNHTKLHVGSVKTVIGHLEGTAGLASLLKASQAVQHGLIPPNLHFHQLNPEVEPFYHHLEVPTKLKPWPKLPTGTPRRASVNSFGFGGTNAHVIIESWDDSSKTEKSHYLSPCWGPFVMSAKSETALVATVASLSSALKNQDDIDLSRLAWTLQTRRTQFTYRASFSATNKEELIKALDFAIAHNGQSSIVTRATKTPKARILGIFTGQGAQWATMGATLFEHSAFFRRTFEKLESTLKGIPYGPTWSLTEELLRKDDPTRIESAEISQPLCTAVQVALVDLLNECGVTFSAVVGHSSGEIAAAYAAGILEPTDAVLIAFYRGYHCHQKQRTNGMPGKMMAVGMAPEYAEAFCQQPNLLGRIMVAAKNSTSSFTFSGDAKAIVEAKAILDEKGVFARILKVDNAYHSHHMDSIRKPYLESLRKAGIKPRRNCFEGDCNWYSSVYDTEDDRGMTTTTPFEDIYWADNLTGPVMFSQAITSAMQRNKFDLALEIGPHPALRGPATETIKHVSGSDLPYHGVLERNKDALDTFSSALGFIWRNIDLPKTYINFAAFREACDGPDFVIPRVEKSIPPYPWDHGKPMLKESRKSKVWRTRNTPTHELLGYAIPSENGRKVHWRNVLKLSDVDWLQGHQFQNQVLFPAAGYLVMAVAASLHLTGNGRSVQLVELQDVIIHNGIVLEEDSPGVDIDFVIHLLDENPKEQVAEFCCTCSNVDAASPEFDHKIFTGRVVIKLGLHERDALPSRVDPKLPMADVTVDRFYSWMQKVGFRYSEPFLLESITRRLNLATVTTMRTVTSKYTIHPGPLDSIFQGLYAAFSYAGDGRVWTTYLPKSFRRVRFNITNDRHADNRSVSQLVADCHLTKSSARVICGDIDVFRGEDGQAEIQAQGVVLSSLEVPSEDNDRSMFWQTSWKRDPLSDLLPTDESDTQVSSTADHELHEICERTAYYYLNRVCSEVGQQEIESMESHFQCLMHWALDCVHLGTQSDRRPRKESHWDNDTLESIMEIKKHRYDGQIDLELIHHLGSNLPLIVRGSKLGLQALNEEERLRRLYQEGLGVPEINRHFKMLIDRLTHRYPRMRILEVGAGTGGTTSVALECLESNFENYTFTDLSPSFFSTAQARFLPYEGLLRYKVLDIEKCPVEQGFRECSYDLVIAANVLHATRSISHTLQHCRKLLRPGGYLVLLELTNPMTLRIPFLFASLPGWWLGGKDGRTKGPTLTEAQWDTALRDNFFSGADRCFKDFNDGSMHTFSVIMSQALDSRVSVLRDPLHLASGVARIQNLLIISGRTLVLSKMAARIQSLLSPFFEYINAIDNLEEVLGDSLEYGTAVICLSGLEEATFMRMDPNRVSAIQMLFRKSKYILWATKGSRSVDPYANIIVGIGRSASREMAHLRLKFVDVDYVHLHKKQPEAAMFSEMLLEMMILDLPGYRDILWSNESEVAVEDGVILTPRVVQDKALNERFNAQRRLITRRVSIKSTPVQISASNDSIAIEEVDDDFQGDTQADLCLLEVLSSSLFRFVCSDGGQPFYISVGYLENAKNLTLTLSEANRPTVMVTSDCTIQCEDQANPDELLPVILTIIVCEDALSSTNGTVWIHNADNFTAGIIRAVARRKAVHIFLTTSMSGSLLISDEVATYIHPRATERELISLLPHNLKRFVDMGTETDCLIEFASSFLQHRVEIHQGLHNINAGQFISLSYSRSDLTKILEESCCPSDFPRGHPTQQVRVRADLAHEQSATASVTSFISWTDVHSVPMKLIPASDKQLFGDHKTYFLIGLTGEVGLSLCEWMMGHGAKYFALASRKPLIPPEMLAHLQRKGATIRVFSLDIADMDNLRNVHESIVSSMPPIAGVANGALVVRDHPFDAMSFEDLEAVFKPKVIGTQNLDELFFSVPLDFFILFSSVASIVGKPAQSSYNAANLFMSTLAICRRKRGLAASVMHFGMLLGIGFLHGQAGSNFEARFRQDDLSAIPEPEFHAIFAQAILSGRPESGLAPELIAGIGTEVNTPWRDMPKFSHCRIKGEERHTGGHYDREQPTQNIQTKLREASEKGQSLSILNSTVAKRVSLALGSLDGVVDNRVGLISMGLDSLIAVEIRSWLLKILDVDIPVLKFLNGSSLHDICQNILENLPVDLKPWDKDRSTDYRKSNEEINHSEPNSPSQDLDRAPRLPNGSNSRPIIKTTAIQVSNILPPAPPSTIAIAEAERKQSKRDKYERFGDMSHAQAHLYFLHEVLQSNAYNISYFGRFHGLLDMERLQQALRIVGKRHEALRSAYFVHSATSRPIQAVLPEPRIILTHKAIEDDNEIQAEINKVKKFRFDIEKGVIMKVTVMSHSTTLHFIQFSHHHIALDGAGWGVFIAELARAYTGQLTSVPGPNIQQSIDMAKRQLQTSTPQDLYADLAFWKTIYTYIPKTLPLFPFAKVKARPTSKDYSINTSDARLPRNITNLIERAASEAGVTPFHFYFASLAVFLARCLGIDDVVIGVVDANRPGAEDLGTIGYFLNMLPARIRLSRSDSFDAVARRSRDTILASLAHSRAPIDMILDELAIPKPSDHHPLFQVAINYRKAPLNETSFGSDGKIEWDGAVPGGNPYDLLLNVAATTDWTFISFITQQNLYHKSDGALLLKWYTRALEALAQDPYSEVGDCQICNETDRKEAIGTGYGGDIEIPWNGTIVDRIDELVSELPEDIAIKDDRGGVLTYAQMAAKTAEIAQMIGSVQPSLARGSYVAMLLDPIAETICCILAILKLGLVWIPLDTRNHQQRLHAVVEECQPSVLLYHTATNELAEQVVAGTKSVSLFNIDEARNAPHVTEDRIHVHQTHIRDDGNEKNQPAMIIYTSGSTGVPKGIVLTHGGLLGQIYGTTATLNLGREVTLQQSPLGFDLMLDQIFLALCNGGTVIIVGKTGRGDPTRMAELMVQHGVTVTHFVPSEYLALLNYGHHILTKTKSWHYAMSGGENLGPELRWAFRKLDCRTLKLVNVYGPAEITVACARGIVPYQDLGDTYDDSSDYLRPSPNYGIEITDNNMNVLPIGYPGEICISGRGVGLGYLKRPGESNHKFIQRESPSPNTPAIRIYRSGDMGRLLPDGTLKVFGRLDGGSQVKIHGFRVELDEIANAIVHTSNGAIVNAAASLRTNQPHDVLIAFVVFDIEFAGDKVSFIEWLYSNLPLPQIMKPASIIPTHRIPASANGKTDRVAVDKLPIPNSPVPRTTDHPMRALSPIESSMKEVWEEVLTARANYFSGHIPEQAVLHPGSDFFQVGGSSILMIKLKSLIEVQFGVTISMLELFHASTLSCMADLVSNARDTAEKADSRSAAVSFLRPRGAQRTINWDLEIAGLTDGLPQTTITTSPYDARSLTGNGGLVVVLTGATGFVGRHLLSRLVQEPRVAQVHCLAMRPDASGKPRHVSVKSDKITEYVGDLSTFSLGLSDPQFAFLTEYAHIIIHNGADVSLLKTYQSLRRANVVSTRTLCEMAIPRRLPLHYVSTASVAKVIQHNDTEPLPEVPALPADPDLLNSVDGYAASKWVSEMLLGKVTADNELPTYVHRLAHVMGEDASELDAVGMLTKYSPLIGALPRIEREDVTGQWDFVTIGDVSKDIVKSAIESVVGDKISTPLREQKNRDIHFINHCNQGKVTHEKLSDFLEDTSGSPLREIAMKDWLEAAREKGLHPLVYEFFNAFNEGRGKMVLPLISRST
ncbi:hybrid PKS-NRPS PsoA [Hypoxylon trugodes]|uniref:hybrid PKS-NRPS PsoA n=1 Tax=Hypoxylon trugodes TaxID=326681 RepID=UPI00219D34CC|nr:hybrid PKS-NRPS PsoA [Hypoxylon trugodes]KAI1383554.1 hybrid PKS-NRPS PsoA [Hypoxylon trugodes]